METIIRDLKSSQFRDNEIIDVKVDWPKTIKTHSPDEFKEKMSGARLTGFDRRGKYLIFYLSIDETLIIHLRMTGKLIFHKKDAAIEKHDRVVFYFANGLQLHFNDTRKFGRFYLTSDPNDRLGKLGPEPLTEDFKLSRFREKLNSRSRMIKSLLLDQSFVAGLGNIYVDEALWEAGIHPEQSAELISEEKQNKLYQAIKNVLKRAIKNKGTSLGSGLGNYARTDKQRGDNRKALQVYQRAGKACPRCGRKIKKIKVAQRSSHYCSNCQRQRKK